MSSIFSRSHTSKHSSGKHKRSPYSRPSASRSLPSLFPPAHSGVSGICSPGGGSHHHSSSSHYKRRPREGYITYLVNKLRRLLQDLWKYARRHPVKAFLAVILPLLSSGAAVGGLLRSFGFFTSYGGQNTGRLEQVARIAQAFI